ncbi:hypothetical protein J6S88_01520 [bacterium]|nr:hypothetical protein [bacterium]
MNKIYPQCEDVLEVQEEEALFLKNLKKVKIKKIENREPELKAVTPVKELKIEKAHFEDFTNVNLDVEQLDLSNISLVVTKPKTIKEILDNEISGPIAELFNFDLGDIQNAFDNVISMISVNK